MSEIAIRPFAAKDGEAINRCFARVFGKPRPLAVWEWKFLRSPDGAYATLGVDANGEVVAQFAGLRQRLTDRGSSVFGVSLVDIMAAAGTRRLGKRPFFLELGEEFFRGVAAPGGASDRGSHDVSQDVRFFFGFPGTRHESFGERYFGYRHCFEVSEFRSGCERWARTSPLGDVVRAERFSAGLDALWNDVGPELGIAVARDQRYLNWRYAEPPEAAYRIYLLGAQSAPRGYAVARLDDSDGSTGRILDIIVPEARFDEVPVLLGAVAADLQRQGARDLVLWLSPYSRLAAFVERDLAFVAAKSQVPFNFKSFHPEASFEDFRDRVFVSMGDYDVY